MRKLALTLGIATAAGMAIAQPLGGRIFSYVVNSDVNGPYYGSANIIYFHMPTVAYVNPYLYVNGFMQVVWTIDGWGAGSDEMFTPISLYHNEVLGLDFEGFGDLTKVPGSGPSGPLTNLNIPMQYKAVVKNIANLPMFSGGGVPFNSNWGNGFFFNTVWSPSSFLAPWLSGGKASIEVYRKITVGPDHGPGQYVNPSANLVLYRL
ncbi:MAG: hypothetical protein KIS66_06645 [Fimbriimonadaceae bacterium]|nr:hypothetical protein [Fimbriimonadaceae bacterium]